MRGIENEDENEDDVSSRTVFGTRQCKKGLVVGKAGVVGSARRWFIGRRLNV